MKKKTFIGISIFVLALAAGCSDDDGPSDTSGGGGDGGASSGETSGGGGTSSAETTGVGGSGGSDTTATSTSSGSGGIECCDLFDCPGDGVQCECGSFSGCNVDSSGCGFCYEPTDCEALCEEQS